MASFQILFPFESLLAFSFQSVSRKVFGQCDLETLDYILTLPFLYK